MIAYGFVPTFTPPGMKIPFTISPSGGESLGIWPVPRGKIQRPSRMTACKYSSSRASESLITRSEIALVFTASSIFA
jgi:hypothetical protein